MQLLDWIVLLLFFGGMLALGLWSYFFKNDDTEDYYVASGDVPWWLAGISHHISGYSGAVFVAFAGLAYNYGFSLYVWWALTVGIGILVGAKIFAVYWVRSRKNLLIQSPLEFLAKRYNVLTQQIMAWCGVLLKIFDIAAKWAAIAILIKVIAGVPLIKGILVSGLISLLYITFGGLWAVMATDLIQFLVQIAAGIVMFIIVVMRLGGSHSIIGMWDQLPAENSHLFNSPYTVGFTLVFLLINFLSYNGGNWGLATRYISSPDEKQASKAAYLSGVLYLVWPLILFFPMWAAPIILPNLAHPVDSYGLLMLKLLPPGLLGLVSASLFAATMSMVASDITTLSAVITRDILPVISKRFKGKKASLIVARVTTFIYAGLTIAVASQYQRFGGVIGLIVSWFGALVGPIAVPLLLGLLPKFRSCGPTAAISSIVGGLVAFIVTKSIVFGSLAFDVGLPVIISTIIYLGFAWLTPLGQVSAETDHLLQALKPEQSSSPDKKIPVS
jgi:Na+/proline symporter